MDKDFLLINKMKNGDESAMESFVCRYYPKIRCYCHYHVADRGYAEDITQETFVKFFGSLSVYRHHGKALNYLYTIAANLCRDFYKKSTSLPVPDIPDVCGNSMDSVDCRLDMEEALRRLPGELREILILYYFQERKQREITDILGIGLPLVKYRLKQAKEQLGELLGKERE